MSRLCRHVGVLAPVLIFVLAVAAFAQSTDFSGSLQRANQSLREGRTREARELALSLVAASERAGDQRALVRALNLVADAYYYEGRRGDMLRYYQRALDVNRALGDAGGIGRSLYNIAYYYERTDPARMLSLLGEARQWAERAGDEALRMNIYNASGTANWNLGRYKAGSADFEASARIGEARKDRYAAAVAYQNVGLSHFHRAERELAIEWLERALKTFEELGLKPGQAIVLGNLGNVAREAGEIDRAAELYQRSLALHREIQSARGEATQLNNLAEVYAYGGHHARSREYHWQALDAFRRLDDGRGIVMQLNNLAGAAIASGDLSDARALLAEAATRSKAIGNALLLLRTDWNYAHLAEVEGRPVERLSFLGRAIDRARASEDTYHLGMLLADRADACADAGDIERALDDYDAAIAMHAKTGTRTSLHLWHARRGTLLARAGRAAGAERAFGDARAVLDDLSRLVATEPFRLGLFREIAAVHHAYAAFLVDRGRPAEAWRAVEEGRARDLRLRRVVAGRDRPPGDAERDALGRLSALQRTLREGTVTAERPALLRNLADAELAYDAARAASRAPHHDVADTAVSPPTGVVLLSYAVHGDELLIIRHLNGTFSARRLAGFTRLGDQITFFARRVATPEPAFSDRPLARKLFDTLLGPELNGLGRSRIVITADGPLLELPFAALVTPDDRFLIQQHAVSLTPSTVVLSGDAPRQRHGVPVLAIAGGAFSGTLPSGAELPDLPATGYEARVVASGARGSSVWIDISESALKRASLGDVQVLHLATHVVADSARPERSGIILGAGGEDDGLLQAREIYAMSLPVRLAVISGCSSGRGQVVGGEGVLGLSHALFSAGAEALVLSLWNISDRATARFMNDFYAELRSRSIEDALAEAQRAAIEDPARRHPAYWAAFFVSGRADQRVEMPWPLPWWVAAGPLIVLALVAVALERRRRTASRPRARSARPAHERSE